jgi:hypothetical protein
LHAKCHAMLQNTSSFVGISEQQYAPMIVPPKPWKNVKNGGYWVSKTEVMRIAGSGKHLAALRKADLSKVCVLYAYETNVSHEREKRERERKERVQGRLEQGCIIRNERLKRERERER